jgi:NCAIR mutase (PurE)-related protein
LREALLLGPTLDQAAVLSHPDFDRDLRTGGPEVVMAEGKDVAELTSLVRGFLDRSGRAVLSRVRASASRVVEREFAREAVAAYPRARMVVVKRPGYAVPATGGRVGILTAGTSDFGSAQQAQVMAEEMGCSTRTVADVGVAGLHRLPGPLQDMMEWGADALVVAAGMDGALPSVVAGLVDVPVIGLPTSRGYGAGGHGVAALLSMLQTCVPGLAVVNVDNGIGAGACAARIANRAASVRGDRARP